MTVLTNKTFDEIKVGDNASLTRELTQEDIFLFARVSGDVNPAHLDIEYAKSNIFKKIVGHGMWTASLISTVLGTKLPGPGTIYLNQSLKFTRPVAIGDKITVKLIVIKKYIRKPVLILTCKCTNQNDVVVLTGFAKVLAPTKKVRREQIDLPEIKIMD